MRNLTIRTASLTEYLSETYVVIFCWGIHARWNLWSANSVSEVPGRLPATDSTRYAAVHQWCQLLQQGKCDCWFHFNSQPTHQAGHGTECQKLPEVPLSLFPHRNLRKDQVIRPLLQLLFWVPGLLGISTWPPFLQNQAMGTATGLSILAAASVEPVHRLRKEAAHLDYNWGPARSSHSVNGVATEDIRGCISLLPSKSWWTQMLQTNCLTHSAGPRIPWWDHILMLRSALSSETPPEQHGQQGATAQAQPPKTVNVSVPPENGTE